MVSSRVQKLHLGITYLGKVLHILTPETKGMFCIARCGVRARPIREDSPLLTKLPICTECERLSKNGNQ